MPAILPEIPACLALTACPNCGYSLAGLADEGTCPECGRHYDRSVIVLWGYARGRRETLANAKQSRLVWVALGSLLSMFLIFPNVFLSLRGDLIYLAPFLILMLATFAYQWSRRKNTAHPGLVQVRLNESECVQYDDLAGSSILIELVRSHAWLIPVAGIVVLAVGFLQGRVGPIAFGIWLPIAAGLAAFWWKPCRRFRRAVRQLRDSDIADVNAAYCRPTAWKHVGTFTLQPLGPDTFRLRIPAINTFFPTEAVDAEIRCTADQAEQLRSLLQTWKANAKSA